MRRRCMGFSMIELLVVIAIISVLMALLLPTLSRALSKARSTKGMLELRDEGIGRTADDTSNVPSAERPTLASCRKAFYRKADYGDGKIYYTEPLCVLKTDDEFRAYWYTTIRAAASEDLEFAEGGELIARDEKGRRFLLPVIPEGEFLTHYGTYPLGWEFLSTKVSDSGNESLSAKVLYSDGHVEYKPYPSSFPATRTVAEYSQLFLDTR